MFCSYRNEVLKDPGDPKYERFRNLFLAFIQELIQQDFDVREALMSNVSEVIEILVVSGYYYLLLSCCIFKILYCDNLMLMRPFHFPLSGKTFSVSHLF